MSDCKPLSTPVEGVVPRLTDVEDGVQDRLYECCGESAVCGHGDQTDITYAVQVLGRHMQAPGRRYSASCGISRERETRGSYMGASDLWVGFHRY